MWKAVQEIFGHVIWNDVANIQDISCGRLCSTFVGHVI